VQAARELREHADHYCGSAATGDAWKEALGGGGQPVEVPEESELPTILAIFDAAIARARGTTPKVAADEGTALAKLDSGPRK
jgi:hypothetical protein